MLKKKDLYIDYRNSKRIDYQKHSHKSLKRTLLTICIILILFAFVGGGFLLIQGRFGITLLYTPEKINKDSNIMKEQPIYDETEVNESKIDSINIENKSTNTDIVIDDLNPVEPTIEDTTNVVSGKVINTTIDNYMQLEDMQNKERPEFIKGIYVSGQKAGIEEYVSDLINLTDDTEINAMVIDLKNDNGEITYNIELPLAREIGAETNYIKDIRGLISRLKEKDIYLIARIVSFKDPLLAKKRKEFSLQNKDGSAFIDKNGDKWVNPYNTQVWDYLVDIGITAAKLGFDEIQFDYIRFSTDTGMINVTYGEDAVDKSRMDIITEFTKYACDKLKPLGVFVSADVYGTIIDSKIDAEIVGQDYKSMAKYLDYICPMIYPSHYREGSYGIEYPDKEPYNLIFTALGKSSNALEGLDATSTAVVRPWLQDFTAVWMENHAIYGANEIRAQIQAVYDAGYKEWLLWNGSNNYTQDGLLKK